ncbi:MULTISPECIES: TonB-dependent receptor [Methylomonas]|uniref:TonB-dependent receptor n=2 Tax=Methylomonas TaxID=416 RepID=A0A140E4G4_9GAMM|nr:MULTISPECIES: TonB-dependent receptor [Methylomonas]AMK75288.1 TonB-dependent receptor [Methylomonas denitrificans]OAH99320.1 TonB-dependent receptor [Methylomonas methanica]TCV84965.1 iron complex outermembrane receptor protein [Methylomonas methanica]
MKKTAALILMLPSPVLIAEEPPIQALEEIVVTAPLQNKKTDSPVPVTVLSDDELRMKTGHSIGDTLKNELGISSQSFGPGVGTPVIRGQTGPRVRVLSNGIGSNDVAAISPDHATSVEPLLAERIEVLRGPATLLYGSGAMGGVVNVIDNRIPGRQFDKLIDAALEQRFDSTSDETSTTMKVEGGKDNIAYHLDGFYRHRNNLDIGGSGIDTAKVAITDPSLEIVDNPKGYLNNTGAEALSGSAGLSWIGAPGFAGVSINNLNNNYAIAPDGTGDETVRIAMRQTKYDFKSELNNPFRFAKSLRTRLGYTDYQHTEIANGEPGAYYTNQSYEGRMELAHQDLGPLRGVLGFQTQASDFNAIEKLTGDSIVPRSDITSYGVFAVESFDIGAVTYQLGTRVEQTDIRPDGFANLSYTPVSASASAVWKLDNRNSLNLAVTRSSRAPQVQELLSDGYHDATHSYDRGDLGLKEETSYNLDLGYRFKTDWLRAEFDLFHNWASDYIFQQRSGEFVDQDGNPCVADCVPLVTSGQHDAIFKGYEAKLIVPMMENNLGLLELSLFSDYTRGEFVNGSDVPRMPPLRYGLQLDFNREKLSTYLRFTRAESQPHAGDFETSTTGYFLLNVGANYQIKAYKDAKLMLFAKGNNLLDQNIRNSTSYLRNFAPEAGRGAEVGLRISY